MTNAALHAALNAALNATLSDAMQTNFAAEVHITICRTRLSRHAARHGRHRAHTVLQNTQAVPQI